MVEKLNEKKSSDWHFMEFFVPITEAKTVGEDFLIRGVAINETTTRNGIKYIASELERAAPSFRGKPILEDHENKVRKIVGRTTENVNYNSMKKGIEFEAKIMDKSIQSMITDGRITDVSIGAKVEDLEHNKKENTMTAIGLEGLEISLVAVPGDPGANLASAMDKSFMIKEMMMNGEEVNNLNDEKEVEDMAEEGETTPEAETETKAEEPAKEEVKAEEPEDNAESSEEKLKIVQAKLAKYEKAEEKAKLKEELKKEIMAELKEQEDTSPPAEEPKEEVPAEKEKSEPEDETKGVVGEPEEEETTEEGLVIEKADSGKGFQIYRDYTKSSERFDRLVRA